MGAAIRKPLALRLKGDCRKSGVEVQRGEGMPGCFAQLAGIGQQDGSVEFGIPGHFPPGRGASWERGMCTRRELDRRMTAGTQRGGVARRAVFSADKKQQR